MRNTGNLNSFCAPQHPTSVQAHHITPQSLFCFALDGDNSKDQKTGKASKVVGSLKIQKLVSRDDAGGILSTPTRRKGSYFFSSSNLPKVNETSQTPTNKYSKKVSQWDAAIPIPQDEIEAANMLANEANLGFGDLMAQMKIGDKSPRSHSQNSVGMHQSVGTGDLEVMKKKSSENPAKSSATGSSAPKNFYHEFKKV